MGLSGELSIYNNSTSTPPGKRTTASPPSTRPAPFQATQRRPSSTPGTATTLLHSQNRIDTLPPSLPRGAGTDTAPPHRGTSRQAMHIPPGMMPSWPTFHAKQNVSMMLYFGPPTSKQRSIRPPITLNPRKFRFAQDEVEFAGFDITPTDVKPSRKYLDAISEFPTPLGITDVRTWFGLVNQVAYAFSMASVMQPFRDLLKPSIPFAWTDQLQQAFTASKSEICQRIKEGVRIFDKNRPTCLATDWSKDGIGYWLFQKHCQCPSREILCCQEGWKVVLVGSRFTHPAESRYAPVEGEALAVADALDKARHFVLGCSDLQIAVDHKPLLKLFGDRSLEDISNTRLRNLKEKTLRYRFRMVYIPGVRNHTSDALSRHPSGICQPARLELQDDHHSSAATCLPASPTPTSRVDDISIHSSPNDDDGLATALCAAVLDAPITWEDLQIATAADTNLQNLSDVIEDGPPDARHHLPAGIRDYFPFIHDLSSVNGVICRGERIVIPAKLRQTCLNALHAAHQGTSGMTARAQTSLFWPVISKDIAETRSKCTVCNSNAPSQPAMPSTTPADPEYPFQHPCADYFHHEGLQLADRDTLE